MQQKNSTVEPNADPRKYEVGQRLKFTAQDPDEIDVCFDPGDILFVSLKNGCGMGIDCVRESDGYPDMAWPTEVELVND